VINDWSARRADGVEALIGRVTNVRTGGDLPQQWEISRTAFDLLVRVGPAVDTTVITVL